MAHFAKRRTRLITHRKCWHFIAFEVVLPDRIELSTSPLPRQQVGGPYTIDIHNQYVSHSALLHGFHTGKNDSGNLSTASRSAGRGT